MVISEFVRETAKQLGDNARFEAELMVMSVMEMDRTRLVLNGKLPVMPQHTYRMKDVKKVSRCNIYSEKPNLCHLIFL